MKDLGKKIHLTDPAVTVRLNKLDDSRIIERYTIHTNLVRLGYPIHDFLNIFTEDIPHIKYLKFIETKICSTSF